MASPAGASDDALPAARPYLSRYRSQCVPHVDWDTIPPTVGDILAVLGKSPGSALVIRGFSLISKDLLQDDKKRALVYTCERGIEVILETMDVYQDSLEIQRLGCFIVRCLSRDEANLSLLAAKVRSACISA